MRILSVELENIKSYAEPTLIEFTSGLNAVCGLNGAGKTTVLESIGFALFDFLPYNQPAFVREGEKSGTIRLRLLARDEREYEVVRRVGSSSGWYVMDVETGTRLAERGESVKLWITSHLLDSDGALDLGSLFQNAVGVPQGAMTTDFVRAGTARKAIFDPLLRVEEYRHAWENLRDTTRYLNDRSADLREEIGRLMGETERTGEVEENARLLRAHRDESERQLGRLAAEAVQIEAQKTELDAIEARLKALGEKRLGAQYDVRRYGDALRARVEVRESARAAHNAVQAAQEGYHLFRAAQAVLKELDGRRETRDGLRAAVANVKGDLAGTARQIEGMERELRTVEADRIAAAELASQVASQDALERTVGDIAGQLAALPHIEDQIARAESEIARLQFDRSSRQKRIADATLAASEAGTLERVALELRAVEAKLAGIEQLRTQLSRVEDAGKRLRGQFDLVTAEATRVEELESQIASLADTAHRGEAMATEYNTLHEQFVRVSATIDYQDVARADLQNRQCPLLDLQCPVVTADGSVLVRFDARVRDLESERAGVERRLAELEPGLNEARQATETLRLVQLELATISGAVKRKSELEAELGEVRNQFAELRDAIAEGAPLNRERTRLADEVRRLEGRRDLAASRTSLEEQHAADARALESAGVERDELAARRQRLLALRTDLESAERELRELANPRARQQALEGSARRAPRIQAGLEAERARYEDETLQFNALSEELQAFETLDEEIAMQRELETVHRPAYEIYLQHRTEAEALQERERAVSEAEAQLDVAQRAEASLNAEEAEVAATYDEGRHVQLKAEYDEMKLAVAEAKSAGDRLRADLEKVERDLRDLHRKRDRLRERQGEQSDLGRVARAVEFIRETIRAAGPAVTEMLLASISQGANDIFAEIMDDHAVELQWDRDYEVSIQRGTETRKFAQLSGGEQMSAALAVRLALLREMSEVDFAFFDEPTQNMDLDRRTNLADQISQVKGFEQLIVISHDDTFEHHTDNMIRLKKANEVTRIESS